MGLIQFSADRILPRVVMQHVRHAGMRVDDIFKRSPTATDQFGPQLEHAAKLEEPHFVWYEVEMPPSFFDLSQAAGSAKTIPALRKAYSEYAPELQRLKDVRRWMKKEGPYHAMKTAPILARPQNGGLYILDGWHRLVVWDEYLHEEAIPTLVGFPPGAV